MHSPQQPLHRTANVPDWSRPSGWARNPRRNRPATAPSIGCGDAAARSGLNSTHPSVGLFRPSLPFRRIRLDCEVAHRNFSWLAFPHSALYVAYEHGPRSQRSFSRNPGEASHGSDRAGPVMAIRWTAQSEPLVLDQHQAARFKPSQTKLTPISLPLTRMCRNGQGRPDSSSDANRKSC